MHYGLSGPDLDYLEWTRRFGAFSEVIHLQQTTPDASHHWPFTEPYLQRGHIEMQKVLDALVESHRSAENSPLSEHLAPADRCWLVAEIIPGSTKNEKDLLAELRASSDYLHGFVPESGLTFGV
jgi:hypothetical protein